MHYTYTHIHKMNPPVRRPMRKKRPSPFHPAPPPHSVLKNRKPSPRKSKDRRKRLDEELIYHAANSSTLTSRHGKKANLISRHWPGAVVLTEPCAEEPMPKSITTSKTLALPRSRASQHSPHPSHPLLAVAAPRTVLLERQPTHRRSSCRKTVINTT